MSRSRLRRLRRSEDELGRSAATESRQDTKRSRGVFGGVSEGAFVTGDGEGKWTAMGTWDSTCGRSADSLSSRQKTEKAGLGDVGGDQSIDERTSVVSFEGLCQRRDNARPQRQIRRSPFQPGTKRLEYLRERAQQRGHVWIHQSLGIINQDNQHPVAHDPYTIP